MSSVSLEQVSRRYGTNTALHPTDLAVADGEFITLLGPSGCGKTTTLRIIAGFVPPSGGRVRFGPDDVTALPPNRRGIGMVFQDYALFPHMTIADNIGFALRERRTPRAEIAARVAELLALIQLEQVGERMPAQLSGGQQQRVALARAIACPPRVLLMDEPLSALDLKLREAMQGELRRLQQQLGITTIFVTHDQAEAMTLSDTIAVMSEGRIVQRGTAQSIYDQSASRFVAAFVGQINLLDAEVVGEEGGRAVVAVAGARLRADGPAQAGPASLGVRPHEVLFDAPGENALPGTVRSNSFAGNLWRSVVHVCGTDWTVETRPGTTIPQPGAAVTLRWAVEHTKILRD